MIPKILLVDDRIENIIALEKLFSGLDVDCIRATSGNEALKKTLENEFALALIDIQMPDMDGYETVRLMRQERKTEHLPVIFISAIYSEDQYKIKSVETGAIDFITKPVNPKILTGKISVHLDLYRHKAALQEAHDKLELLVQERTAKLMESNEQLRKEIIKRKSLEKALFDIEDRERERIGRDLHDDVGQLLTGISFKSNYLESSLKDKSFPEAEDAARITFLIDRAKNHLKELVRGLLSIGEGEEKLISALKDLASKTKEIYKISCDFKYDSSFQICNKTAVTPLYRIAQEAVRNAVKHSKPEHIEIALSRDGDEIKLLIKDNGTGINVNSDLTEGMGLKTMSCRADMIGASFDIDSSADEGTQITCTFPDALKEGIDKDREP
jgi:signal transduction histidine kinase